MADFFSDLGSAWDNATAPWRQFVDDMIGPKNTIQNNPITRALGVAPQPQTPAPPPTGPTREQATQGKIDENTQIAMDAVDAAMKAFTGDPTSGTPGLVDRTKARLQPLLDTIPTTQGNVRASNKAATDAADASVAGAKDARTTALTEASTKFDDIWRTWRSDVDQARAEWQTTKKEFKDLTAQQTQGTVDGLKKSSEQAKSQLRAQAEQLGIPRDQIAAQERQITLDTSYESGRVISEASAGYAAKRADIDTAHSNIVASLTASGLGAATSAFGKLVDTHVATAANVIQAEAGQINANLKAGESEIGLAQWVTGVYQTAEGLVTNAELLSAQALQGLAELKAQVAKGDTDAWLSAQQIFAGLKQQADLIDATFQT